MVYVVDFDFGKSRTVIRVKRVRLFRLGNFPVVGEQEVDLRGWSGIDADKDIFEPLTIIHAIGLAGGRKGIKDGEILSAGLTGGKKRVFPDQRDNAALYFGGIF